MATTDSVDSIKDFLKLSVFDYCKNVEKRANYYCRLIKTWVIENENTILETIEACYEPENDTECYNFKTGIVFEEGDIDFKDEILDWVNEFVFERFGIQSCVSIVANNTFNLLLDVYYEEKKPNLNEKIMEICKKKKENMSKQIEKGIIKIEVEYWD